MKPTQDTYPVYEANQVLFNSHLNQSFAYEDEQIRLTRANLIGIGIACGLELRLDTSTASPVLHLSRGCGVTSEGYLIVEPEEVDLTGYRTYTLPPDLAYPLFLRKADPNKAQYPLWELFPADEPNTALLNSPAGFLNDKVVLLFLELKKEGLRNCSPNNCDDKGAAVTATVRRLLINVNDLNAVLAEVNQLGSALTPEDLESSLQERLSLPDVRLPRFDVPNTGPASSQQILAAFHAVFRSNKLVHATGEALSAAYKAFQPLVQKDYASDPFAQFTDPAAFGFLDDAPAQSAQVRALPYYYDLFDDLLAAYDELRRRGVELMCACCPPEGLFPRHLMLGPATPAPAPAPPGGGLYRQNFLPAAVMHDCEQEVREFRQLFQRLVEQVHSFTPAPPLSGPVTATGLDPQIRVTPSSTGLPLSGKAIPFYYGQDGQPPLYRLWNVDRTAWNRANQNLSYRSDEYAPAPPAFITEPLRYDLEPYPFLRVEGHLGKPYQRALGTLLSLKSQFRLPIEIVALRTGAFDETMALEPGKVKTASADLEAIYDALREELLSILCEGARFLYDVPVPGPELPGGTPKLPLLAKGAPAYRFAAGTMGAWYEQHLASLQAVPYIDVDQNNINSNAILTVYCILFPGNSGLAAGFFPHAVSIYYFSKLAEILPASLDTLGFADFQNKYQDLVGLVRYFRTEAAAGISDDLKQFIPQEELIDHCDEVLFACKLEPIRSVHEAWLQRLRELKQKQFLSFFLQKHPGIQHKSGVPLGGTFILVYHELPAPLKPSLAGVLNTIKETLAPNHPLFAITPINPSAVSEAFTRIQGKFELVQDPDVRYILSTFTGQVPERLAMPPPPGDATTRVINAAVAELAPGTVIADFFLPYVCCSDGASVQFVLPPPPLGLSVKVSCTDEREQAEASLTPTGGIEPYTCQLDQQPFQPLTGNVVLAAGTHTLLLRDSAGSESARQTIVVPGSLRLGEATYTENPDSTYQVAFNVSGGTPPYAAEPGAMAGNRFASLPMPSGQVLAVTITDHAGCKAVGNFQHVVRPPCTLPCDGQSRRSAYRLWLQPPVNQAVYETYRQEDQPILFRFNGVPIDLPNGTSLLSAAASDLNADFHGVMAGVVKRLNEAIRQALGAKFGPEGDKRLVFSYSPTDKAPFASLFIEYFVCETFTLEFGFAYAKPTPPFALMMRYTNEPADEGTPFDGAILINRRLNTETRIPRYDSDERNQCDGTNYKKLCPAAISKPKIQIERGEQNRFTLTGEMPANLDNITGWVWDILGARSTEPFYAGKSVSAQITNPAGPVRLTVITSQGCFSFNQRDLPQ